MPMKKSYTFIYLLNNFETNQDELIDYQLEYNEFSDIFKLLSESEAEPPDNIIENILSFSKSLE